MKKPIEELLSTTREAAAAFVEDMPHIRQVANSVEPNRGDVRRLSPILRRLLVDKGGDLRDIAPPRIGALKILSPDNSPAYKAAKKEPIAFFQSGGAVAFGVFFRGTTVFPGDRDPPFPFELDPMKTVALPMDNFLSQEVLCFRSGWINRRDVIKYIANVASGVHSGQPKDITDQWLNKIRRAARYSSETPTGKGFLLQFNFDVMGGEDDLPLEYSATDIDPVLIELLAVARYLVMSPDIGRLEQVVRAEFNIA